VAFGIFQKTISNEKRGKKKGKHHVITKGSKHRARAEICVHLFRPAGRINILDDRPYVSLEKERISVSSPGRKAARGL